MDQQLNTPIDDNVKLVKAETSLEHVQSAEIYPPTTTPDLNTLHAPSLNFVFPVNDIVSRIKKTSSIMNEIQQSSQNTSTSTNSNEQPVRYGTASAIPHENEFDLKALLNDNKSNAPKQTHDLLAMLKDDKPKLPIRQDNQIQQLLADNHDDRKKLVESAWRAQQDLIKSMDLD